MIMAHDDQLDMVAPLKVAASFLTIAGRLAPA